MSAGFGRVALPLPLAEPYTYRVPPGLADRIVPGARVIVPVRRQEMVGIVVGLDPGAPDREVRDILAAPDPEPALPPALLETAEWMAGYYGAPLGLALRAMLPAALWGRSHVRVYLERPGAAPGGFSAEIVRWLERKGGEATSTAIARALRKPVWDALARLDRVGAVRLEVTGVDAGAPGVTERVLALVEPRPSLAEREELFRRTRSQRRLFETLEDLGGGAPVRHLRDQLGFSDHPVRALVGRGLARLEDVERIRDPFADLPGSPPPGAPSPAQQEALTSLAAVPPGEAALLFGVTGSGKTFVYLEAIRAALARGRGAILLVPEISLTPQIVARVRGAFGDEVAVLHSGLSDGERADAWRVLRRGERRVAVGARSAIFAPVQDLGVIVIDEEHEAGYKNGETPRYHAREVAGVRASLENASLILGSATPSAETMARVDTGVPAIRLPDRIGARPMPEVELVDLRHAERVEGTRAVPWTRSLDEAVTTTLARGEQALLLLNRRGFATYLQCEACGEVRECPHCSISLTVHDSPALLRCHYCGYTERIPDACLACGHAVQRHRGVGTQQLERVLAERFPLARLARMDLDTTSTRWSHHRILSAVERGEVDLLLGTQMIAKGLDFPNVTLVGVVDADTGLHLPDFRSAERTFQLLAQVAGRTGRGPKGGRVLIQTRTPGHHALRWAAQHDVERFLEDELASRREPPYPPYLSLVNVLVSGVDEGDVGREAAEVADWFHALVAARELPVRVLGPAPCPIARIKTRWRWHVLLKGPSEELGRVVRYAASRITKAGRDVRVVLDRDPVSLL